jgi:uncharacterized membrane protein HdeD (DUF308 family)
LYSINKLLFSRYFYPALATKLTDMSNKHEKKFLINMLIGFILTTSGISAIIYSAFTDEHKMDWIFWAAISAVAINAGLLFLGSSLIHKVKADLIRRQKQKSKTDKGIPE